MAVFGRLLCESAMLTMVLPDRTPMPVPGIPAVIVLGKDRSARRASKKGIS
jgi:hypothetical protein